MQLWLLRHADVQQAAGLCYGATDVPAQADRTEACAVRLAPLLPHGVRAWTSPLRRCRALADALQALRPDLQATADPRLAEMDFGTWEGQSWDAIGPDALAAWTADFLHHRPGGGESVAQFLARVRQALEEYAAPGGAHGLWITHAGVIKAVRLLHAGTRIARADEWPRDSVACGDWLVLDLPPSGG
ncbi:histidine phosphatase family protein [Pseudorhodoferax sp.]|uniref:histidine phosphatase family protein n=1 Tax=Pseudorhodoferax sp. TaxID=1993553 RepID=UPI0039E358B0